MASNKTNISDIDAQIEALKKKKQALREKEKEEKKKLAEARHKKIGALVEKALGEINDMKEFETFLDSVKAGYKKDIPTPESANIAEDSPASAIDFT